MSRRNSKNRPSRWLENKPELLSGADLEMEPPEELDVSPAGGLEADGEKKHPVLGPFRLEVRQELLRELLEIQKKTGYRLIQDEELDLIRRYWTEEYRVGSLAVLEILEEVFGPAARREQVEAERKLLEQLLCFLRVREHQHVLLLYALPLSLVSSQHDVFQKFLHV